MFLVYRLHCNFLERSTLLIINVFYKLGTYQIEFLYRVSKLLERYRTVLVKYYKEMTLNVSAQKTVTTDFSTIPLGLKWVVL